MKDVIWFEFKLSKILGIEVGSLDPNGNLFESGHLDSLASLEVIELLSDHGVERLDELAENLENLSTISRILRLVEF
jgi:acyl carrier protein